LKYCVVPEVIKNAEVMPLNAASAWELTSFTASFGETDVAIPSIFNRSVEDSVFLHPVLQNVKTSAMTILHALPLNLFVFLMVYIWL
jgi:hypothetical protein